MQELKDKVNDTPTNSQDPAPPTALAELPLVMTVDEVASLLRVNRKTIYDMVARKQLPGVIYVGRKLRISRRAVLQWLQGQGCVSHKSERRCK